MVAEAASDAPARGKLPRFHISSTRTIDRSSAADIRSEIPARMSMDPSQLIADDANRAAPSRAFSGSFMRSVGFAWRHRRLLVPGFGCSLLFAALHAASLAAVLPVLKLILDEEGLPNWVDRESASRRLGFEVDVVPANGENGARLVVRRISAHHPLTGQGLHDGATIVARDVDPRTWLTRIAEASEGEAVDFEFVPAYAPDGAAVPPVTIIRTTLRSLSIRERAMRMLVGMFDRQTLEHDRLKVLMIVLSGLCLIALAANVFRFLAEYLVSSAVLSGMVTLRAILYEKVLRLPMSFFAASTTSDLVTQFVQDVQEIQRGLLALFGKLVTEPLKAIFILGLALTLDWRMTCWMLLIAPAAAAIFLTIGRQVKKANHKLLRQYGVMIGALSSALQAIDVVKAYTTEELERKRLSDLDARMFRQQRRIAAAQAALPPAMELLAVFGASAVSLWLGLRVLRHELNVAEFMQLALVVGMLLDPIRKGSDVYTRIQRGSAGADRIFRVLDLPPEALESSGQRAVQPLRRHIELRHVTFTYPTGTSPALRDVSLTIRRGECLALVGPNGSGKTTLVNLLLRFYDPQSGELFYDDTPLRELRLVELRRQFAMVTQKSVVFDGTIRDNIVYGESGATEDRVRDAARRAYAEEFILARRNGYDERVGEGGVALSGGQRQRIVIARAILRNAPILIFDEATSQVDTESDEKIHQAIRELSRDRTTIMIAHRPSTFRFADRVVVMDAGRIVDAGTHEELLTRCALYRTLCQISHEPVG